MDQPVESPPAVRPLLEVSDEIRRLHDYATPEDLSSAIAAVLGAMERSLRTRLRRDAGAPEAHRLNAFAPDRLTLDEVVKALRTRDLISLEAAGTVHEARAAADRAAAGDARAADGDIVASAVERLRRELSSGDPAGSEAASEVRHTAASAASASTASEAGEAAEAGGDAESRDRPAVEKGAGSRWMRWIAAAFAAAIVVGAAWVAIRSGGEEYEHAMAAFRAGRTDSAAAGFERVVVDQPRNVTAMLYLARSYRRLDQPAAAAEVLRRAVAIEPEDGDVRRELGHLFMDLGRPIAAVAQYERALEHGPENPLSWAALIRALRQLGEPRAELLLRDAPAEARAMLGGA